MSERYVSPDGRIDLRLGRWQDVLADVESCDAVITDPPYGERTHGGQRHGRRDSRYASGHLAIHGLTYAHLADEEVGEAAAFWGPRCGGWACVHTSHDLAPLWASSFEGVGRYTFAPLPCVLRGMSVRLAGDGPSSWTVWMVVSRPRTGPVVKWGTLPGAYVGVPFDDGENVYDRSKHHKGGKPLWLMRAIVRDYSRPGDLIVDPFAGGGTTLLAAAMEGRRAIGAEMDPETYAKAVKRLKRGYTTDLFEGATP